MIIKKTKLAIALVSALVFSLPMSQAFAHEDHCDIEDTELGDTMKYMKSELRAYNKAFDSEDQEGMQEHINELLKLSERGSQFIPTLIAKDNHAEKVEDLTAEQKTQFTEYQTAMQNINATFKAISETTDETEIQALLNKVKSQNKEGHKKFRLNCKK